MIAGESASCLDTGTPCIHPLGAQCWIKTSGEWKRCIRFQDIVGHEQRTASADFPCATNPPRRLQGSLGSNATPKATARGGISQTAREERDLLLSTRDLTSYQGQFSYVVPSKDELEHVDTGIAEVIRIPYVSFCSLYFAESPSCVTPSPARCC